MGKGRAIKSNKEKRTIVSNKKKERDQFKKEMDMIRLKNKIGEMIKKISNEKRTIEINNDKYKKNIELINEKYNDNSLYNMMFQNYMKNEYTLTCISFMNKIIIDTKHNHLEQYKGKYNFNKIFTNIAKELFLNQYELILLSLYLEYINISLNVHIIDFEESLLYLCFYIKKSTLDEKEIYPIIYYLNKKYENFENNYQKWFNINEKKLNEKIYFSNKEINKRFREYNTPFSEYCGENFIDYNYIVDRILTMSLPYVDISKDNINNKNNNNNVNKLTENNNILNISFNKNKEDKRDSNHINQIIFKTDINFNNNSKGDININNSKEQINSTDKINIKNNNDSKIYQNMTPNNILHSIYLNNKLIPNQINNKILVSNLNNSNFNKPDNNNPNIINSSMNNNLILNPIFNQSRSSLFFQQKHSLLDLLDKKNNGNPYLDEEGEEALKQILKNSSNSSLMRNNQSFDSQKFSYGFILSNNNFGNGNNKNATNYKNVNSNNNGQQKYKSNDIPFKPLNIICNKNFYQNVVNSPNIIYNNNFGNNKSDNDSFNMNNNKEK